MHLLPCAVLLQHDMSSCWLLFCAILLQHDMSSCWLLNTSPVVPAVAAAVRSLANSRPPAPCQDVPPHALVKDCCPRGGAWPGRVRCPAIGLRGLARSCPAIGLRGLVGQLLALVGQILQSLGITGGAGRLGGESLAELLYSC